MSKFWEKLAVAHEYKIERDGLEKFRKTLSPEYSTSGLYDNAHWLEEAYRRCKKLGVEFYYEDCLLGEPFYKNIEGKNVSQDLIHSCYEAFVLSTAIDFSQVKSICEIGGGNGRTAEAILKKIPNIEYTIVDINVTQTVAKWYLNQIGINNVKFVSPKNIPAGKDLYLAISVLSELYKKEVEDYMEIIKTGKWLYLKDWRNVRNNWNETDVNFQHYSLPKWRTLFDRDYPFYPGFFEALYVIEK